MRVFVTGATGFVGSAVVGELTAAGHTVLALVRSEEAAGRTRRPGVETHLGELAEPESLVAGARACDGVIHTAFIHDFSRFAESAAIERRALEAMLTALEGAGRPFVVTSGTGVGGGGGRPTTEDDPPVTDGPAAVRGATEEVVRAFAERGVRVSIVRLPQVHGPRDHGFVARMVQIARETGVSAYLGEGANRWPTVHRLDAARLYRLALEAAKPGQRLHAVAEEGVPQRAIAEAISEGLGLPLRSLPAEAAEAHFGWLGRFASLDMPSSSAITRRTMGWEPREIDLPTDLREGDYFA